jgi:hypothetical protein
MSSGKVLPAGTGHFSPSFEKRPSADCFQTGVLSGSFTCGLSGKLAAQSNYDAVSVFDQTYPIAKAMRTTIEPAIIMYWYMRAEACRNRQPIRNTPTATSRTAI